jgi:hypothetical protein
MTLLKPEPFKPARCRDLNRKGHFSYVAMHGASRKAQPAGNAGTRHE